MPSGGHNRLTDEEKRQRGTLRPARVPPKAKGLKAITDWPQVPEGFTPAEARCWARLGVVAVAAGTVGATDLIAAEYCARSMARLDAALADPDSQPSHIGTLMRLVNAQLAAFGLSPSGRNGVNPLPKEETSEKDEFA